MSHALRVRGLKLEEQYNKTMEILSHALRVRGLKLIYGVKNNDRLKSHALRVRGLKPCLLVRMGSQRVVARSTRAWIETLFVTSGVA